MKARGKNKSAEKLHLRTYNSCRVGKVNMARYNADEKSR
jgi:hypothetical protein